MMLDHVRNTGVVLSLQYSLQEFGVLTTHVWFFLYNVGIMFFNENVCAPWCCNVDVVALRVFNVKMIGLL